MTKHTQPKTQKPLMRMAAGIAAGAAVLAITGGFAYLMFSVQNDMRNPGASNPEPASKYIEVFRDYFETRAGHPIDFDFSTLCGTDFDETWEFDDYTVTLDAGICDGLQFYYIATVTPHNGEMPEKPMGRGVPYVRMEAHRNDVYPGDDDYQGYADAECLTAIVDNELRADGTYRIVGSSYALRNLLITKQSADFYDVFCSLGGVFYASSDEEKEVGALRPITINVPDTVPEYRALSAPLSALSTEPVSYPYQYTYAAVTPLGISLTNYTADDVDALLSQPELFEYKNDAPGVPDQSPDAVRNHPELEYKNEFGGSYGGITVPDAVTLQKKSCHGAPEQLAVSYAYDEETDDSAPDIPGTASVIYNCGGKQKDRFLTCTLPFVEPQNLDEISSLYFTSNEQSEAVSVSLNSRACYIDCFRDYYETRAGHPVDFDFSTLCGTEFDEVWEFDAYTVTLNAAICDGWRIDYIYTLQPKYGHILDLAMLPELTMCVADASQATVIAVCDQPQVIAQLEADGTLRLFSSCHYLDRAMPIPQDGQIYAMCPKPEQDTVWETGLADGTIRPITVNMPDDVPEVHPLDGILNIHFSDADVTQEFVHGVVTPLGIILTNYFPKELDTLLHDAYDAYTDPVTDAVGTIYAGFGADVTVQAYSSETDMRNLNIDESSRFYIWNDPNIGEAQYATCWLPFTEPQNLDDVQYLQIGSNAQENPVNLSLTGNEQSAVPSEPQKHYTDYFRDYYETRAGHPIDFDFSTLCGTEFDEVWEFEDYTVTLNAAICDGWEIAYIYTLKPHFEWTPTADNINNMPELSLDAWNGDFGTDHATSSVQLIDTDLREDGTLRVFGSCKVELWAQPVSTAAACNAACVQNGNVMRQMPDDNMRDITVNLPEYIPGYRALSGTLSVKLDAGAEAAAEFTHAIVTPLGITLMSYDSSDMENILIALADAYANQQSGIGLFGSTMQNAVFLWKYTSDAETQKIAVTYGASGEFAAVGAYSMSYFSQLANDDENIYMLCRLPFTEPQNLDVVQYLQLSSNEQEEIVVLPLT